MRKEDGTQNQFKPHKWFAWYPVKTDSGWVWLRTVTRVLEWQWESFSPETAHVEWKYKKI